ncbi:MAG: hypothetical protein ABJC07_08375 [Acidobacteriota bacterium]
MMATPRIGELLVAEGFLSEASVQRALGFQRSGGDRVKLGSILLNWELLSEESLLAGLAKLHRRPGVSWASLQDAPLAVAWLLPASHAARLAAIPYSDERRLLRVAFVNPSNIAAIDEVSALTGRSVAPGVATEARLLQAQHKFYGRHVPMEYRTLLQKLDRRPTAVAPPPARPSVAAPTLTAPPPVPAVPADPFGPGLVPEIDETTIRIHVEGFPAAAGAGLSLPEFPSMASPAAPMGNAGMENREGQPETDGPSRRSPFSSEDSLSDWVGEAISAFKGAERDESDPSSPAGISNPALFGRANATPHPESIDFREDDLPATNAFRTRRPDSERPLSEAHIRGVPSSIPPFRRATDPTIPFSRARTPMADVDGEDADDAIAGMWRPAPPEEPADAAALAHSREELADFILEGPLLPLPRVMLLGCGGAGVTGWRGRGERLSAEVVSSIRVPFSELSIFSAVLESGVPHFGAINKSEWPRALEELFGRVPPDCAVFPIRVLDAVAAFLYADRAGAPMHYEDFAMVARATASAASVLSRFVLQPARGSVAPS